MSRTERFVAFLVVLGAFLVRVWMLEDRPMHHDEGVNGAFVDEMQSQGFYAYRPDNYHGPLHFYVLFAAEQLFGRSLWVLRMPTVLAGTAAVAMMLAFRRWLSFRAVAVAAAAMALSPAMIYYSRDAIHEMWLVLFTLVAAYGGIGVATEGGRRDRWWFGLGLTGMVLTKETYLLHAIATLAVGCVMLVRSSTGGGFPDDRPDAASLFNPRRQRPVAPGGGDPAAGTINWKITGTCAGIVIAFYSGFGMHWGGVMGLLETWGYMLNKGYATGPGSEDGQHKEIWYYVRLLWRYEWPALAGMVAAPVVSFLPARGIPTVLRFLALFGLGSFAGYALISYKTPWCMLAALPPFFFVVGWLFDRLAAYLGEGTTERAASGLLVGVLLAQPAVGAWRLNFRNPTDDGGHYVYVQATRDIEKLLRPLRTLIARDPLNRYLHGNVFIEAFPLKWELGDMPKVYFFDAVQSPYEDSYDADFLVFPRSSGAEQDYPGDREWEVRRRLRGAYFEVPYLPRAFGEPSLLFLSAEKFAEFFPGREPEFHPRIRQEVAP